MKSIFLDQIRYDQLTCKVQFWIKEYSYLKVELNTTMA